MLTLLGYATGAVVVVMWLLWWQALRARNFGYVDIGWSANFMLLAAIYCLAGEGDPVRRMLIGGMYALWGARLALHLAQRIVDHPEEGRYAHLRREWGVGGNRKFFGFFQLQGLLNIVLSLPLLLAAMNPAPTLHVLEVAGLTVWALGLVGESVADRQLKHFKRDPANADRVCETGLWGWSRHPNYFFEWLVWVGYALFALAAPHGWVALSAPLLMLYFLLEVTGIKATEEQALRSKGDAYRRYQQSVSAFVPLPRFDWLVRHAVRLMEQGRLPDRLIRYGIRRLLKQRLQEERGGSAEAQQAQLMELVAQLRDSPVAIHTDAANEQHYEVPASFYQHALGRNLKYSSGYYPPGVTDLSAAEAEMLRMTVARAELRDGEHILELGCGWGSLTLYMAAQFPASRITAVSNSNSQREFILARARELRLDNIEILTCDVNRLEFPAERKFDRAVSVEMFEHMRNYRELLQRIASWLKPGGTLFVHIFTHREYAYPFEVRDDSDWMAKHFFTGGIMPSDDLLLYFQDDLRIRRHWHVDGSHYSSTAEGWLANMDRNAPAILPVFAQCYGETQAAKWWNYWRVFFMACAELWGYGQGREWQVSHYLFAKPLELNR